MDHNGSHPKQEVIDKLRERAVYNMLFSGTCNDDGLARRIGQLVDSGAVFRRAHRVALIVDLPEGAQKAS